MAVDDAPRQAGVAMRPTPPLVQHRGAGPDLQRAQDYVRQSVAPILASDIIHGNLLTFEVDAANRRTEGIYFDAGVTKKVPHRLGRRPNGWMVVRDFGTTAHKLLEDAGNSDQAYLSLTSTVDCGVFLWVF